MTTVETVENALALAHLRLNQAPEFQIFSSIVAQLQYLLSVLQGEEKDRSRLKTIIIGHYAVREFAESDPELADALNASQSIAFQVSKGLKV